MWFVCCFTVVRKKLVDQLVERVFNDAFRAEGLELRNDIPDDGFVNDRFHGQPAFFRQVGDGGAAQGRQGFHEAIEGSGGEVHFQTHFPAGFQSALSIMTRLSSFCFFHSSCIVSRFAMNWG